MDYIVKYDVNNITPNDEDALEGVVKLILETIDKSKINDGERLKLSEAKIIVSGGRGMQDASNFKLLYEFADELGGVVGASRATVNAGWMDWSYLVGISGSTVKPDIYIACGISGSIQHQAGMGDSKYIIAINKDIYAPIFKICDFGIVGDLFEVIPFIIELIKKRKTSVS